jgi:hypothetical protein
MATKKKQTKKPCKCKHSYGTLWVAGSNIQPNIIAAAIEFAEHGGIVYFLNGKPCGGIGQPACH